MTRLEAAPNLRGYVICSQPRSGTNLLCQILESTGVLGRPQDYFNGAGFRARGRSEYPLDREAQLAAILTEGCTPNGVYGVKMFCARFDQVVATRWPDRLPGLHFIFLDRADLLGQALSNVRAAQTGSYRANAAETRPPFYDPEHIRRQLQANVRDRARWQLYFARNAIVPLTLSYEQIVAAPQAAAEAVARLVGVGGQVAIDMTAVALTVQRDALTEDWRQRFEVSQRDTTVLDRLVMPRRFDTIAHWALRQVRQRG